MFAGYSHDDRVKRRNCGAFRGRVGWEPSGVCLALILGAAQGRDHSTHLPKGNNVMHARALVDRVRGEFNEMPGLRLTPAQAARLWGMERHTSERILDGLALAGFLLKNKEGAYLRASGA